MYGIETATVLRDHQIHNDLEEFSKMTGEDRDQLCVSFQVFIFRIILK